MTEPTQASCITWGFLVGAFVVLYCFFGFALARWFKLAYAVALGATMMLSTAMLAAPAALLHVSTTI